MVLSSRLMPGRPTVLVVDDSRAALDGLCNLLQADCNALFGHNGLEALALATSESPDLILLDVAMPGMDGYEVLRRLKEEPATQSIPVIFLTAPGPGVSEIQALELGAIDFITKPYDPEILRARMRNQLAYKRSLDRALALSQSDALTGIANRRHFDEHLNQEWNRALRSQRPISMVLIDIDHFKRYNDALGHPGGDVCLQRVATILERSLQRSGDFVARYGGEEFACILSETDADGALEVARRIAANMAQAALPHPDSPIGPSVTLSMGVCAAKPGREWVSSELTLEADRRLYEAKHQGRNRIYADLVPDRSQREEGVAPMLLVVGGEAVQRRLAECLRGLRVDLRRVGDLPSAMDFLEKEKPQLLLCADLQAHRIKADPRVQNLPFIQLDAEGAELCPGFDDLLDLQSEPRVVRSRIRLLLEVATMPGAHQASAMGMRFLVMAPAGPLRAMLLAGLSREGVRTTFATTLGETLAALRGERPDALVLDLNRMGSKPESMMDRMRAIPGCAHLPVLALLDSELTEDSELLTEEVETRVQDRLSILASEGESQRRFRMLARCAYVRGREAEAQARTGFPMPDSL